MSFLNRRTTLVFWSLLALVLATGGEGQAQTITRTRALSFGTFALKNNDAPRAMTIQANGSISADSAYIRIIDPQLAIYQLTGFPESVHVMAKVSNIVPITSLGGGTFGLSIGIPPFGLPVFLDGNGSATVTFGGTITTSGNGIMYADDDYAGSLDFTIEY